jgi:hypothetical protein
LPVPVIRNKPDITAPDGGNNTFFGSDADGDAWPNFFGTSAAAPHAAGVAALLLECDPGLTPTQIRSALTGNAIDMQTLGFDFDSGYGLLDADTAAAAVCVAAVTADKVGVRRNTTFFLDLNGNNAWDGPGTDGVYGFGAASDVPVSGDWNGDGVDDIGIRRNNTFFLDLNGNRVWDGPGTDGVFGFGAASDVPAIGDWNGDGVDDLGVRRNNAYFLDLNGNRVWDAGDGIFGFGAVSDLPVIGDWNGDGFDDLGVRRNNLFFLDLNGNRAWDAGDGVFPFGIASDIPVAGDWNADGIDDLGVRRPGSSRFYLDDNGNRVWDGPGIDGVYLFGVSGDTPVVGKW